MNSLISKEITKKIIKEGMGLIHAEIELINAGDLTLARRHIIGEEEIHRTVVRMLVDTGAYYMCINEAIQEQLQLPVLERRKNRLADDTVLECDVVGPIEVRFKNRRCVVDAMVLPDQTESLLGAIPLEAMDVLIDPIRQELIATAERPDAALRGIRKIA